MDVDAALVAAQPHTRPPRVLPLQRYLRHAGLVSRDPCPDVHGMASVRKLRLLNALVSQLPRDGSECYLEVGTYQGKSLIAALLGNEGVTAVACDNFSIWEDPVEPQNERILRAHLDRYGLAGSVRFFNEDFRTLLERWRERDLPPVGVYFFDGPHDEESQYDAIVAVEPFLADRAVVAVDDWRHAADSTSRAEAGTRRAVAASTNAWRIEHELPARRNGDRDLWWNGLGVLSFARRAGDAA